MLEVTIERSSWLRGQSESALLLIKPSAEGESKAVMCCLGFACLAAGMTPEQIEGRTSPGSLYGIGTAIPDAIKQALTRPRVPTESGWLPGIVNNDVCNELMRINDSQNITEEGREGKIIDLGLSAGIQFTIVD